jgi:hypothetical protein
MFISKLKVILMKGFAYIDFETSMANKYYLAGVQIDGQFEQVVLTTELSGFAKHHSLKVMNVEEFARSFVSQCNKENLTVTAYSEAEQNTLAELVPGVTFKYLNLRQSAKRWISRHKRKEFDNLPELLKRKKILNHQRRQLRNSLYSVSRLLGESQLDGFKLPTLSEYGYRRTSTRFKAAIDGLDRSQQEYNQLSPGKKKGGTKALNHNRFDVQILPTLHAAIFKCDPGLIAKGLSDA